MRHALGAVQLKTPSLLGSASRRGQHKDNGAMVWVVRLPADNSNQTRRERLERIALGGIEMSLR